MDKIYLKDIEIFANHGVFKEEKNLGQKFILSLELSLDIKETAKTCDLTKSVHYGELCHKVIEVFQEESLDLIESVVNKVANFILDNYSMVNGVKVLLKKPSLKVRPGEMINFEFSEPPKKIRAFIWNDEITELNMTRGSIKVPDYDKKLVVGIEGTYKNGKILYAVVLDIRG